MRSFGLCLLLAACNQAPLDSNECSGPPRLGVYPTDFAPMAGNVGQHVVVSAENVECAGVTVTFDGVEAPLVTAEGWTGTRRPSVSVDVPSVPFVCNGEKAVAFAIVRVTNAFGSVESARKFTVLGGPADDAQCAN